MWRRICCIVQCCFKCWHSVLATFYLACMWRGNCHFAPEMRSWRIDWFLTNDNLAVMSRASVLFKPRPAFFVNLASFRWSLQAIYKQEEYHEFRYALTIFTSYPNAFSSSELYSGLDRQTCRLCDFWALGGTIWLQEDDLCHVWRPASGGHRWAQIPHLRKCYADTHQLNFLQRPGYNSVLEEC